MVNGFSSSYTGRTDTNFGFLQTPRDVTIHQLAMCGKKIGPQLTVDQWSDVSYLCRKTIRSHDIEKQRYFLISVSDKLHFHSIKFLIVGSLSKKTDHLHAIYIHITISFRLEQKYSAWLHTYTYHIKNREPKLPKKRNILLLSIHSQYMMSNQFPSNVYKREAGV